MQQKMRDDFLRLELFRTISNLEVFLRKLGAEEYYSSSSKRFLQILVEFTSKLKNSQQDLPESLLVPLVKQVNHRLIPLVRYVQRSEVKNIPWSVIPNFQLLISKLLTDQYLILIRPQWHWNYSVLVYNLGDYLEQTINAFTKEKNYKVPEQIHVISFPVLEKTNFLLHTIFGHEIGHFYQQRYVDAIFTREWERKTYDDIFAEIGKTETDVFRKAIETTKAQNIYKGAIREILPDVIAYYLFGPSIIFALYFISVWFPDNALPDKKNDYYPPLKMRIRILFDRFLAPYAKGGAAQSDDFVLAELTAFAKTVSQYLDDKADLNAIASNNTCSVAFAWLDRDLNDVISYCESSIGKNRYVFESSFIKSLILRLDDFIPPNEVGDQTARLADLFLCGWLHFHKTFRLSARKNEDIQELVDAYKQQSLLLLKAANLIHAKAFYDTHHAST